MAWFITKFRSVPLSHFILIWKVVIHRISRIGLSVSSSAWLPRPCTTRHQFPLNNISASLRSATSSSPDSTISSGNGKSSEREEIWSMPHSETGSMPHSASSEGKAGDDSAARKKLRLTKEQTELLEETFKYQNSLNQTNLKSLHRTENMTLDCGDEKNEDDDGNEWVSMYMKSSTHRISDLP